MTDTTTFIPWAPTLERPAGGWNVPIVATLPDVATLPGPTLMICRAVLFMSGCGTWVKVADIPWLSEDEPA